MRAVLCFALIALAACSSKPTDTFAKFEEDYWNEWFRTFPSSATGVGIHDYDGQLEDLSADAVAKRVAYLNAAHDRLAALPAGGNIDAEILDTAIHAELMELTETRSWKTNPMGYVGAPGGAIDVLMKRNFAPPAERLQSVIARLEKVPGVLAAMKVNVSNPPKEFTDLATRMASGSVGFFKNTVAAWAKDAAKDDAALLAKFTAANNAAAAAMEDAAKWLKDDLSKRSTGSYAIGAAAFSKKLALEEMIDDPLDKILAIGEANLEKDYKDFVETANLIDPKKTPAQVMHDISNDHPSETDLIPATRRTLKGIQQFLIDKKIIDLPTMNLPLVEETPPYARSGSFASMDTPGAYESKAKEAFYYVTPVEKDWDAKHKEEHLRLYNKPVMEVITIHEAFPGHYVQFIYAPQFPTKTRKLYWCSSNAEGWAHYTEQMMIEEGYGAGDPKLKLAQLHEALLRDARYVVGIKLHTRGMTVEEGAKLFVDRAMQEPANAYEEARRGAYNPTYLYYTLGKLEVYKLREEYRKKKGAEFKLNEFHADFVKQGAIPIKLIQKLMLGA
ncbi:MAG: DUF885 domain-containing protein [Acidobacteria bacterium]|nr:DUF885 domain-containing protein [Acidobacteriota bacterium]